MCKALGLITSTMMHGRMQCTSSRSKWGFFPCGFHQTDLFTFLLSPFWNHGSFSSKSFCIHSSDVYSRSELHAQFQASVGCHIRWDEQTRLRGPKPAFSAIHLVNDKQNRTQTQQSRAWFLNPAPVLRLLPFSWASGVLTTLALVRLFSLSSSFWDNFPTSGGFWESFKTGMFQGNVSADWKPESFQRKRGEKSKKRNLRWQR